MIKLYIIPFFFILLFWNSRLYAQAPTITSFSPTSGAIGTSVTITGTNFNAIPANNKVWFGPVMAAVSTASTTQLTVIVPAGANYQPITVTNITSGLAASTKVPFIITFPSSHVFDAGTLGTNVDFSTGTSPRGIMIGDLDGDGKPDIAVANGSSSSISLYRNISVTGTITTGSFSPRLDLTTGTTPYCVLFYDLDCDGKPDLIVSNYSSNTVSVYRNTSTPGSITASSFAAKVDFPTGNGPRGIAASDIDGDGKPELAVTNYGSTTVSIFRNTSSPGSITTGSLAVKVDFPTGNGPSNVVIGDIDGDGKPDLAISNNNGSSVSVIRNTSSAGSITLSSFADKVDFTSGGGPTGLILNDIDSDGKPDLIVVNNLFNTISIFKNTCIAGDIVAGSFSTRVDFPANSGPQNIYLGDFDGDGKPDLAISNNTTNAVSIFRNTCIAGTINTESLSSKIDFVAGSNSNAIAIGDIDGDGKPDVIVGNNGSNSFSVLRNTIPLTLPQVVIINSFTPASGPVGTEITINGSNFNTNTANNVVWFGAVKATVSTSNTTRLTVVALAGSTYKAISATDIATGLTSNSILPFIITFPSSQTFDATTFSARIDFNSGTSPHGVAIGDIDGDNKPDLVVANGNSSSVSVYRNISSAGTITNGSFAPRVDFATGSTPFSVLIGDIDGDGKPDLAVTNQGSSTISLLRNTSSVGSINSGSFSGKVDFQTESNPRGITLADLNGDGKPDIIVANNGSDNVSVFKNTSISGSLTAGSLASKVDFMTGGAPSFVQVGDIDGDGKKDLVVTNSSENTISILRNTITSNSITTSSFATKVDFSTPSYPLGLALFDIDGDGKLDIATVNYTGNSISLFGNLSVPGDIVAGSLSPRADFPTGSATYPEYIDVGDIDGDGKPDIAVTNGAGASIFRNISINGTVNTGSLTSKIDFVSGTNPDGIALGDIEGDGKPELLITNAGSNNVSVFRNTISGPLPPSAPLIGTIVQPSCTLATGSVNLTGLPSSGTWTLTRFPGGTTSTGTGPNTVVSGLSEGTYTFSVKNSFDLTSDVSSNVVINSQPVIPTAPSVGTISQPTCILSTGSVVLNGLPGTGSWTLTKSPGGTTTTGTGVSKTISGISSGTYTYTVTGLSGCASAPSSNVVINVQPATPSSPTVGPITQTTCELSTGSVVLTGLPGVGSWTLTRSPGGAISTGSGTSSTLSGLSAGTYTYTVTNESSCTSVSSGNVTINAQPIPTLQASAFFVSSIASASMTVNWTRGNGAGVIVIARQGGAVNTAPVNGTVYTANSAFGTGTELGTGNFVVYYGTGTSVHINSLTPVNSYYFSIYEYGPTYGCFLSPPLTGTASTINAPACTSLNYLAIKAQSSSGIYTSLGSNGTVISTTDFDDSNSAAQNIGFTFNYNCQSFTQFILNTNGFIKLGSTPPSSPALFFDGADSPSGGIFNSTHPDNINLISAFNHDLMAGTGTPEYRIYTSGSAPNRICTIQFKDVRDKTTLPLQQFDNIQFQIKLYETSNIIEFIYGDWTPSVNASAFKSAACGLKGSDNTNNQLLLVTKASTLPWDAVSFNNANYSVNCLNFGNPPARPKPDAGRTFRFVPIYDNDIKVGEIYALGDASSQYSNPQSVSVNIANTGRNSMSNIPVTLNISGANSFTDTKYITLLNSGENAIVTFADFTAVSNGSTNIVVNTPSDDFNGDNTRTWLQNTNDFTSNFASTTVNASTCIGDTAGTIFYAKYHVAGSANINSVIVNIGTSTFNVGKTVFGTVLNEAGAIIGRSDNYVIQAGDLGQWRTFTINNTPSVTNSFIYAGFGAFASPSIYYPIGAQYENPLHPDTYYFSKIDGTGLAPHDGIALPYRFMLGVTFSANPPVAGTAVSNSPVCSGSSAILTLNGYTGNVTWEQSLNGSSNWINVSNATGANSGTCTVNNLTSTTYFRAEVTQTGFSTVISNVVTVIVNSSPTAPAPSTITHPTCSVPTGNVIMGGLPASGSWTLTRSPGGAINTGTGSINTIFFLPPGTFTFVVTNSSGCSSLPSAEVVINSNPAAPAAPVPGTITQPTCTTPTGSVVLSGLPATGSWMLTKTPGGNTIYGSGTTTTIVSLEPGTFTYSVTNASGCISVESASIIISAQPIPSPPVPGTVTQPTCTVSTGSVVLTGLPATGNWTLYQNPLGTPITGSGASKTVSGLAPGTYSFNLTNAEGCTSSSSSDIVIKTQPLSPGALVLGQIIQPTCSVSTGSIMVNGLPSLGFWTLTRMPDGTTTSGTGTGTTVSGLPPGSYTFFVTNSENCNSVTTQTAVVGLPGKGLIPKIKIKWSDVLICLNRADSITSYQWYNGSSVATGKNVSDKYFVTNKQAGIYKVQTIDRDGCKNFSNTIAIGSGNKSVSVFPNPARDNITVNLNNEIHGKIVISIMYETGTKVMEFEVEKEFDDLSKVIAVSDLKEGIYIVKVALDKVNVYYTKIVVIK